MSRVLRPLGWILLLFVLLLVVALVVLRFRPEGVVWVANKALSDTQITTDGLLVRYFPPSLSLSSATVVTPDQSIDLNKVSATFDTRAWRGDAPFWAVTADTVGIDVTSSEPTPTSAATNVAIPNLAPFLSFTRLGVKQLEMTGDTPLSASLSADRTDSDTLLDVRLDQGGTHYTLTGTINSAAAQPLAFRFNVAGAQAASETFSAQLAGTLANNGDTTLTINEGTATLGGQDNALTLDAMTGVVKIPASGDKVDFEDLTTAITSPAAGVTNLSATMSGTVTFGADALKLTSEGNIDASQLSLELAVANTTGVIDGKIDVSSEGLPDGIEHAPFTRDELFPATLSSIFKRENTQLHLTELSLDTPKNALKGNVSISTGDELVLVADLTAPRLFYPLVGAPAKEDTDVEVDTETTPGTEPTSDTESPSATELATNEASATAEEVSPDTGRIFTDTSIDWSWITSATIDAKLAAATLALQDAEFQDLQIKLHNEDSQLQLDPFSASLGEGGFNGSLKVALQSAAADRETEAADRKTEALAPIAVTAAFEMAGVALEAFGLVPKEELSGGQVEALINLTTAGNTTAQLAAGLNGDILMMVEEATLMNDFVEVVGSDIVMETLNKLNPFAKQDPTTELSCALVRFSAEDGKLTTKNQLVMETTKMEIIGSGDIDLNNEKLSIGITPNAKAGVGINIGSAVKFLKLGGTLGAPRPAVSAGGLLKSGLAIGAAISTGGASVVAEGLAKRALNAGSACEAARKQAGLPVDSAGENPADDASS